MRHSAVPLAGHKISMTGKLVWYGVEISQLALDDQFSMEGEQKLAEKARVRDDRIWTLARNKKVVRYAEIAIFLFRARGANPALITQFYLALLGVYRSSKIHHRVMNLGSCCSTS